MAQRALVARSVSKTFGALTVLRDFDFDLEAGEVHALLGHNGSGKTTFIKTLAGVHLPDPGAHIEINGAPLVQGSPKDSYQAGLRFVHQRPAVIGELDAADNLALGQRYRKRFGFMIDWRAQREAAEAALHELDDSTPSVGRGPLGDEPAIVRTKLAIGRALSDLSEGGVLVLDEPTASLAPEEVSQLFSVLEGITAKGVGIIYITHRLREVYEIASRITLLRDGRSLGTHRVGEMDVSRLVNLLSDGKVEASAAPARTPRIDVPSRELGDAALVVKGLSSTNLTDVSFEVERGEILGVCGLDGSGREDLARAVVGALPVTASMVQTARGSTDDLVIRSAERLGIVMARESRAKGSLVDEFTVRENMSLPLLKRFARAGVVSGPAERSFSREWIDRLDVRPPESEAVVGNMSGGNRQKVVIGRALSRRPEALVLDDPTAGVDVGASHSLHELFRVAARKGIGVLLVSSDLEEIVALADRVLVLDAGRVSAVLEGDDIDENALLQEMS